MVVVAWTVVLWLVGLQRRWQFVWCWGREWTSSLRMNWEEGVGRAISRASRGIAVRCKWEPKGIFFEIRVIRVLRYLRDFRERSLNVQVTERENGRSLWVAFWVILVGGWWLFVRDVEQKPFGMLFQHRTPYHGIKPLDHSGSLRRRILTVVNARNCL